MEQETRLGLATSTLGRLHSTIELFLHLLELGAEHGIQTHNGLSSPDYKTGAFNHSANSALIKPYFGRLRRTRTLMIRFGV